MCMENGRKSSKIMNDEICFPFCLLIILCKRDTWLFYTAKKITQGSVLLLNGGSCNAYTATK